MNNNEHAHKKTITPLKYSTYLFSQAANKKANTRSHKTAPEYFSVNEKTSQS